MIYLNVPFAQKDQAKSLGARWDPVARKWYIPQELSEQKQQFSPWLEVDNLQSATSQDAQPLEQQKSIPQDFFSHASVTNHNQITDETFQKATKGQPLSEFLNRIQQVIWQNFAGGHWVVAEISNINERRGHLYLELSETDSSGRSMANARAMIWKSQVAMLQNKFRQETQMELTIGQKVLLLCEVQFHPQFGLSLVVQDIDGSFSLGELEQKVKQIREKLQKEGIYTVNKQQILSTDFFRIAVISPPKAAGLGDFQADAKSLSQLGLCEFDYYHSSFQGGQVEKEFAKAFKQVSLQNSISTYDALVIIRGGGAKLDLHQLNEYSIAKGVAEMPIPVLTGIGHERDNTILDEVAHSRFDTPSKVIHFIWQQIQQQAMNGKQNWLQIQQISHQQIHQLERNTNSIWQEVERLSHKKLVFWKQATLVPFTQLQQQARVKIQQQNQNIDWAMQQIQQSSRQQLNTEKQLLTSVEKEISQQAYSRIKLAKQQLKDWMALIFNAGPKVQIERGFAVISNQKGDTITSKQQAIQEKHLNIEFKDGTLAVSVEKNPPKE